MRKIVVALALLGACGTGEERQDNASGAEDAARTAVADAVETASMTGLYEGGAAGPVNQLCIIDRGSGDARFGLVVWGANMHSCSGTGSAKRDGESLHLTMAGDETCTITASLSGDTLALPAAIPDGCAYYCGARARLNGVTFTRKGSTAEDAMQAKDLVGEPLCTDMAP